MVGPINFLIKDRFLDQNKIFYYCLACSMMVHLAILGGLVFHKAKNLRKLKREIEVTYIKVKPQPANENKTVYKDVKVVKNSQPLPKVDFMSSKPNADDFVAGAAKDVSKFSNNFQMDRKKTPQIAMLEVENANSAPGMKSEKITNPQYLNYNESIRQKIKERAYQYVKHKDFEAGSVYLTFSVTKDGTLQDVKIIEARTKANGYLREIGPKSVREAGPFAPFPKDLNYPELTFNVVMSFEVGN